jgi:hypothetical protein
MSLSGLLSFLSQADKVLQVIACIDHIYSQNKKVVESSWKAKTLNSPNFNAYKIKSTYNKILNKEKRFKPMKWSTACF